MDGFEKCPRCKRHVELLINCAHCGHAEYDVGERIRKQERNRINHALTEIGLWYATGKMEHIKKATSILEGE